MTRPVLARACPAVRRPYPVVHSYDHRGRLPGDGNPRFCDRVFMHHQHGRHVTGINHFALNCSHGPEQAHLLMLETLSPKNTLQSKAMKLSAGHRSSPIGIRFCDRFPSAPSRGSNLLLYRRRLRLPRAAIPAHTCNAGAHAGVPRL